MKSLRLKNYVWPQQEQQPNWKVWSIIIEMEALEEKLEHERIKKSIVLA